MSSIDMCHLLHVATHSNAVKSFSVLETRVFLGVTEVPSAFILKGQAVHEGLSFEDEAIMILRRSGNSNQMTQHHIPAYPNVFLYCI
jgi:hypothetical protein